MSCLSFFNESKSASGGRDGYARVYEYGTCVQSMHVCPGGTVTALGFISADKLVTGDTNGMVYMWKIGDNHSTSTDSGIREILMKFTSPIQAIAICNYKFPVSFVAISTYLHVEVKRYEIVSMTTYKS